MEVHVGRVQITSHVHATEDRDRVLQCLGNILPGDLEFRETRAEGTFKNPIIILDTEVKSKGRELVKGLLDRLSDSDRRRVREELGQRFSGGTFFFRLSKDDACREEVSLGEGVQVAVSLTTYPTNVGRMKEEIQEWLG